MYINHGMYHIKYYKITLIYENISLYVYFNPYILEKKFHLNAIIISPILITLVNVCRAKSQTGENYNQRCVVALYRIYKGEFRGMSSSSQCNLAI